MNRIVPYLQDRSTLSLIITNIFVIGLAIFQGWDVAILMWVYWLQSVIIGFFNFLRILSLKQFSTKNFRINGKPVLPTRNTQLYTAFFFAFHFGFFHFIYSIFLAASFRIDLSSVMGTIFLFGIVFFVNHSFSYIHNKVSDTKQKRNIGTLMFFPYARIIPMHITLIFGTIIGSGALVLFLSLKAVADVVMHVVEHARPID